MATDTSTLHATPTIDPALRASMIGALQDAVASAVLLRARMSAAWEIARTFTGENATADAFVENTGDLMTATAFHADETEHLLSIISAADPDAAFARAAVRSLAASARSCAAHAQDCARAAATLTARNPAEHTDEVIRDRLIRLYSETAESLVAANAYHNRAQEIANAITANDFIGANHIATYGSRNLT